MKFFFLVFPPPPSAILFPYTTLFRSRPQSRRRRRAAAVSCSRPSLPTRSEEHTSELQSRQYLVCRLLLEKKNDQERRVKEWPDLFRPRRIAQLADRLRLDLQNALARH